MYPVSYYADRLIGFLPPFSAGAILPPSESPQLSFVSSAPGDLQVNWTVTGAYSTIVLEFRKKP